MLIFMSVLFVLSSTWYPAVGISSVAFGVVDCCLFVVVVCLLFLFIGLIVCCVSVLYRFVLFCFFVVLMITISIVVMPQLFFC